MGSHVNPDQKKFSDARLNPAFVDKSELLHFTNCAINDPDRKFMCVSCPRRFGKSTNAAMLRAYYSAGCDGSALFHDLKIASFPDYEVHMNKYPLIYLDISGLRSSYVSGRKDDPLLNGFITHLQKKILLELSDVFPDVISFPSGAPVIDENNNLSAAIQRINSSESVRFVFVIDEWDCIFREEKNNLVLQEEYINLLRSLFKGDDAETCIHLVYMTGILPIKKYRTQSALNNFDEYSMVDPDGFAPWIGFSEAEVQILCEKFQADLNLVRQWYEGYHLPGIGSVYNPMSVVRSLRRGKQDSYWPKTESYEDLKQYIAMDFDGLRQDIVKLVAGESVRIDTGSFQNDMISLSSRDDVLTLLVHLGYLAFQGEPGGKDFGQVRIPNWEIRKEFQRSIKSNGWEKVAEALERSNSLLESTWKMDAKEVAKEIEKVHEDYSSLFDYNSEESLRCVIQLAWYTAREYYTLIHGFPSGKGRADVVFLPLPGSRQIPMIVELKYNRSSNCAIRQIKNNNYVGKLSGYQEVLLVGINYSQKTKKHTCKIEKWTFRT